MRMFYALGTVVGLLSTVAYASLPTPGEPAATYADGNFTVPDGTTAAYAVGTSMNISWNTDYKGSNLYLVVDEDYANSISLTINLARKWFVWDVAAKTSNASSIYVLRVVDTYGTNDEQKVGGFMSATFYVYGGSSSSSGTSSSAVTTSLASIASSDFTTSTVSSTSMTSSMTTSMTTSTTISNESSSGTTQTSTIPSSSTTSSASATTSSLASTSSSTDTSTSSAAATSQAAQLHLSAGVKAGIGVGISLGVIGICMLGSGLWFFRKSQNKKKARLTWFDEGMKPDPDGHHQYQHQHYHGRNRTPSLPSSLDHSLMSVHELGPGGGSSVYELGHDLKGAPTTRPFL